VEDDTVTPTGLRLRRTLRGHNDAINGIAWSPDGQILASASSDTNVILWKPSSGELFRKLEDHPYRVFCVAWAPDGHRLASGSNDNLIRIYGADSGKLGQVLVASKQWIGAVAWSPDGQTLVSGSGDTAIQLWDTTTWKLRQTIAAHSPCTGSLVWSPDGGRFAAGGDSARIYIWRAGTAEPPRTLDGHESLITSLAWSPNGQELVSASADGTLRVWNPDSGWQREILAAHKSPLTSVSFSSDSHLLASKSTDNTVRLWRCDTWQTVAVVEEPASQVVSPSPGLAFHPKESVLATLGERDTIIRLWNVDPSVLFGAATAPVAARPSMGCVDSPGSEPPNGERSEEKMEHPRVFVSYSWDDEPHKIWVRQLGERLRADGVDIILDQWHVVAGDQLPEFMESSVRDSKFTLIVCTPNYRVKCDERRGGVGYEGTVMTAEVWTHTNHRKFIPLLRTGEWENAAPSWLLGARYIDLRGDPCAEANYDELLQTIHGLLEEPPPLGPVPDKARFDRKSAAPAVPANKSLDQVSLGDQILVRLHHLWSQDPKVHVGSERFTQMADKDDVHEVILGLGREGLISHGEPITTGVLRNIQRIPGIKITMKGKTRAQSIMLSLSK